jgi:hypothetical protein
MLNKKLIFIYACFVVVFYIICWKYSDIYKEYLILFKKSGVVPHFNLKGQLDGENYLVTNGHVETQADFLDGEKDGWTVQYYKTGKIAKKTFFKLGKANGLDYVYYESGKLKYSANYINNKQFGNLFWYFENGKLDSYAVYDIKGESFCLFKYDQSGKIIDMQGLVVSHDFFSIDSSGPVKILDFNLNRKEGYHDIKDLYIVVAEPPDLHLHVKVKINEKYLSIPPIIDNYIRVPNLFNNPCIYKIYVESHLLNDSGKVINGINIQSTIKKD